MKNTNENAMNHRLEIGDHLKCGEVFIKNLDGYKSLCAVECQLCEDRSICSLTDFMEHLEIWHSDWEDELQHDEMQEVAEEFATTTDEVIQPFEKVLIVTTKTSSDLAFSESEEISEILSEHCDKEMNESFDSYTNSLDGSEGIAYTVNVAEILNSKSETSSIHFEQQQNVISHSTNVCSTIEYTSLEELECQASPLSSDYTEMEQCSIVEKEHNAWANSNNVEKVDEEDDNDDDEDDDSDDEDDKNLNDRSEDSGVEKSEVSSLTASTPQHLTSEDEAEQRKLFIKEQVRIAMNEPPMKPKLTTVHLEKLLELYESHSRLWQKSHPEYNRPKLVRKSWKEITRTWNRACQQKFNMRDIRVRISTLCNRYLKERRRREMAYEINEPKKCTIVSRFKYFDKMRFLDTHQNTPYEEYTSRLTQEHEKLLEIYSHFPILWSNTDKHHESVELREKAYNDISTALQLIGIHIPPKMIRQRLTTLRKRYRLEKMRHLHCKLQGKSFETSFKQYESMKFLDRYIAPFVCDTCGKIFRKLPDYRRHIVLKKHEDMEESAESNSFNNEECELEQTETEFSNHILDFQEIVDESEDQNLIENETCSNPYYTISHGPINNVNLKTLEEPIVNYGNENVDPLNTNVNFENHSNENTLISMNTTLKQSINNIQHLLEVPYVLQSLEGNEDFGGYFNNEQYFTLTTAANDAPVNSAQNDLNSIETNIENASLSNTTQDNIIPMNITLQVIENGVEISSNSTPFVPIELILDETVNNLVSPAITQDSESMKIVAQYFNENQLIPVTTANLEDVTKSHVEINKGAKFYANNAHQIIPMAMSYEDAGTLFDSTAEKSVENYFNQNQFMPINDETFNHFTSPIGPLVNNQSTQIFSTTINNSENQVIESLDDDAIHCIQHETEKDAYTINSIEFSDNGKTTNVLPCTATKQMSKEETIASEKLSAKIECGSLQLQVDLPMSKESSDKSEPSLLGRLPREQALELIARYRDFPELWHPEHDCYTSRRIRRLAWKTLAKDLNKNLNTNFNWLQVQRKILDYVKYYRHERRRIQNKKGCTQWTFYDNFNFLDEVLRPPSDLEKRIQQRTTTLKIIEIYKAHPQMWNTRHPEYTKRHQRQRSVADMRLRLQEVHNINIEEAKLKQRILELRKEYRSTKIARITAERRNESFEPLSQFEFYEPLQFLDEHVPPFNCGECKMEFKCFTDYNFHMKKEHKDYKRIQSSLLAADIDKSFTENICHICGIKFTLRHNLLQHLNRHYVGRTLPCSVCGKKFFTKNALREHERVHTKEPGVICADCGQTFVNTSKLNQHMKRHRNQRDHKCEQCNKFFYTAFDRDRHVQRHLQIRDKVCPVCGRAFVSGSAFYSHMKLHNDKKEYVCNVCSKEFAQYAGLYKHRKRYHPGT